MVLTKRFGCVLMIVLLSIYVYMHTFYQYCVDCFTHFLFVSSCNYMILNHVKTHGDDEDEDGVGCVVLIILVHCFDCYYVIKLQRIDTHLSVVHR